MDNSNEQKTAANILQIIYPFVIGIRKDKSLLIAWVVFQIISLAQVGLYHIAIKLNNKVKLTKNDEEQIINEAINQIKEKMVLHMLEDYNNNPLNEAIPLIAAGALIRGVVKTIGTRIATRAAGKIKQGVNAVRNIRGNDVINALQNYTQYNQQNMQQQQNSIPPSYNTLMMQQINQQNASNPQ